MIINFEDMAAELNIDQSEAQFLYGSIKSKLATDPDAYNFNSISENPHPIDVPANSYVFTSPDLASNGPTPAIRSNNLTSGPESVQPYNLRSAADMMQEYCVPDSGARLRTRGPTVLPKLEDMVLMAFSAIGQFNVDWRILEKRTGLSKKQLYRRFSKAVEKWGYKYHRGEIFPVETAPLRPGRVATMSQRTDVGPELDEDSVPEPVSVEKTAPPEPSVATKSNTFTPSIRLGNWDIVKTGGGSIFTQVSRGVGNAGDPEASYLSLPSAKPIWDVDNATESAYTQIHNQAKPQRTTISVTSYQSRPAEQSPQFHNARPDVDSATIVSSLPNSKSSASGSASNYTDSQFLEFCFKHITKKPEIDFESVAREADKHGAESAKVRFWIIAHKIAPCWMTRKVPDDVMVDLIGGRPDMSLTIQDTKSVTLFFRHMTEGPLLDLEAIAKMAALPLARSTNLRFWQIVHDIKPQWRYVNNVTKLALSHKRTNINKSTGTTNHDVQRNSLLDRAKQVTEPAAMEKQQEAPTAPPKDQQEEEEEEEEYDYSDSDDDVEILNPEPEYLARSKQDRRGTAAAKMRLEEHDMDLDSMDDDF